MRAYAGHTYKFVPNSWPSARTDVYYVQTDGVPSSLGNMGSSFVIEFPEEGSLDGYIYLVFAPTSNGSGSFKIDLTDHPVENEHGSCPHESESYTVAPVLVNGVPYGTNFTIEAHKYAFFKAELSSIVLDEYDMFRLWYGHDHYQWVSLWFKSNGTWVEFQATDGGNVDYGEYDVTDADQTSWTDPDIPVVPDDGYIYIQMHNDSNSPLNVVGNDLGINIF